MTLTRAIGKTAAWIVGIVALIIVAAGVFIVTFDWNRAKPWVNEHVSTALGRSFAINGDLRVDWRRPQGETGWRAWVPWPRISATQLEIGNPDWAKGPKFVTVDAAHFDLAILPLLAHQIVIPSIDVVNPAVDLERLADGRNTWTFQFKRSGQPTTWKVRLDSFAFAKGTVVYRDALTKADLTIGIDTLGQPIPLGDVLKEQEQKSRAASAQRVGKHGAAQLAAKANAAPGSGASAAQGASGASAVAASGASAAAPVAAVSSASASAPAAGASGASGAAAPAKPSGPTYAFGLKFDGRYKNVPIAGTGKVGGVLAIENATQPFPLQADVKAGDTRLAIVGTLTDPMHLAALDLRLWLQGTSMSHLYQLTGITLPDTPPYATEGRLIGQIRQNASVFRYENFNGRVGGSDLHGTLTWAQREPRPKLSGELVSNLLQFSDLAPVIGADSAASKKKRGDTTRQPPDRVLPVAAFRTERWSAIDADVKFTGRKLIKSPQLPITNLYTHILLQDGVLTLEPLQFGVAGGTLATNAHLDGSRTPLKGRFTLSARHLKLKQLFPTQKVMQTALGEINGDASLSATGNSPAALAATSTGEVKALVTDGRISLLLMEAAGLNVANVVYEKLFGTRDVNINCAAIDFVANDGMLEPKVFALDTDDALINVDGPINLRDESLDLKIHPHTKGFRIFSLRSPLYAKGTFKNPKVGVEAGALALRAGAMVGLGLINPFAALIPLIAPSNNRDVPCAQLFGQMNAKAAQKGAAKAGK
ncbi:AsmA family protein [Burkholderia latens]|uniref:AsmA family protein n=1 Tax=Burkholderia latens TaxID=488446 RepID=UPI00158BBA56|nr:AsmA family protein [Burkholderia latens]